MNRKSLKEFFEKEYDRKSNFNDIISKIRKDRAMNRKRIFKIAAVFMIGIMIMAGGIYAGNRVFKKVEVEPERIDFIQELKVTQEDLDKFLTKEEALISAKEKIKRFGLEIKDEEIDNIELLKNPNLDNACYVINPKKLTNVRVMVNAVSGEIESFDINPDLSLNELEKCTSKREDVLKGAEQKIRDYGYGEEYKISYVSSNDGNNEEKSYLWYITFAKEYDGGFNYYQSVTITYIPKINFISQLTFHDEEFENNDVLISKEEAIEIAKQKDKVLNKEGYILKNVDATLEIKRVNPEVYLKENGLDNGLEQANLADGTVIEYYNYRMNGVTRNVYVVELSYEDRPIGLSKKIYVDATTGDVVGGEDIFDKVPTEEM